MDPLTASALISAGGSLAKYLFRPRQKRFEETAYGKRLQELMREGAYGPSQMSRILGRVGKSSAGVAQTSAAGYRGRLASMGMSNSIAGAAKEAELKSAPMRQIGDTAEKLAIENEFAKQSAKNEFAQAKTGYQEKMKDLSDTQKQELFGGLAGAAGSYAMGKVEQAGLKDLKFDDPASVTDWISKQPDVDKAIDRVRGLSYSQWYAGRGGKGDLMSLVSGKKDGTISDDEFLMGMQSLGVDPQYITMWVNWLDKEK